MQLSAITSRDVILVMNGAISVFKTRNSKFYLSSLTNRATRQSMSPNMVSFYMLGMVSY